MEKSKFRFFFSKIQFWIKISENLSTYSTYECPQLKKYKIRDQCLRKLSNFFLNLLRVLRGKLNLRPPHGTFASALKSKKWLFVQCSYRTNFWKSQIKLDLLSSQTPLPPRAHTTTLTSCPSRRSSSSFPTSLWTPKCNTLIHAQNRTCSRRHLPPLQRCRGHARGSLPIASRTTNSHIKYIYALEDLWEHRVDETVFFRDASVLMRPTHPT